MDMSVLDIYFNKKIPMVLWRYSLHWHHTSLCWAPVILNLTGLTPRMGLTPRPGTGGTTPSQTPVRDKLNINQLDEDESQPFDKFYQVLIFNIKSRFIFYQFYYY